MTTVQIKSIVTYELKILYAMETKRLHLFSNFLFRGSVVREMSFPRGVIIVLGKTKINMWCFVQFGTICTI